MIARLWTASLALLAAAVWLALYVAIGLLAVQAAGRGW